MRIKMLKAEDMENTYVKGAGKGYREILEFFGITWASGREATRGAFPEQNKSVEVGVVDKSLCCWDLGGFSHPENPLEKYEEFSIPFLEEHTMSMYDFILAGFRIHEGDLIFFPESGEVGRPSENNSWGEGDRLKDYYKDVYIIHSRELDKSELKEQTPSPCQKLGYKEGDEFFYTGEDDGCVHYGDKIILDDDDGTDLPFFKRVDDDDRSFCHYLADVTPASDPFVAYNGVEYTRGWYKFYDDDPSEFILAELEGIMNDDALFPFCASGEVFAHCEMVNWSEYNRGFISTSGEVNKLYKLYTLALEGTGQKPMSLSEFTASGLLDKYKELCE